MGTLSDLIELHVSTHTVLPNGTSRNDNYFFTSTLATYAASLPNIATPLYTAVANERSSAGGNVNLRLRTNVITQSSAQVFNYSDAGAPTLATPVVYPHISWQDTARGDQLNSPTDVSNWITSVLLKLTPINLYPDVNY